MRVIIYTKLTFEEATLERPSITKQVEKHKESIPKSSFTYFFSFYIFLIPRKSLKND